jgi:hypothetical protein
LQDHPSAIAVDTENSNRKKGKRLIITRDIIASCGAVFSLILFSMYLVNVLRGVFLKDTPLMSHVSPYCIDYGVFYTTGKMTLLGQISGIYQLETHHAALEQIMHMSLPFYLPWVYPPIFLLAVTPLALLPYSVSLLMWLFLTMGFAFYAVLKILPNQKKLALLLLGFTGLLMNLRWGQNGFLTTGLIGLGLAYLEKKPVLSGICFGLMAYKPQFAIFLFPVLLLSGKWKVFLYACLSALGIILVSVIFFGTQTWIDFFQALMRTPSSVFKTEFDNVAAIIVSPLVFVQVLGGSETLCTAIQAILTVSVLGAIVWVWRNTKKISLWASALILGLPLMMPNYTQYDLVLLALSLILLSYEYLENGYRKLELILLALLWLMPALSWPLVKVTHLQICPLVLIAEMTLVILRVRREKAISVMQQPLAT